jgi:hypothetical protein
MFDKDRRSPCNGLTVARKGRTAALHNLESLIALLLPASLPITSEFAMLALVC